MRYCALWLAVSLIGLSCKREAEQEPSKVAVDLASPDAPAKPSPQPEAPAREEARTHAPSKAAVTQATAEVPKSVPQPVEQVEVEQPPQPPQQPERVTSTPSEQFASQQSTQPVLRPLQDLRLLLTMADVKEASKGKSEFELTALAGFEASQDKDALYFEPTKGQQFGFALQVFGERDGRAAKQKWDQLFATYPNSVEIAPISGPTFFAYWGEVLHVGFLEARGNLVVIVSCGQKYCDSDALYALAQKVASRIK